MFGGRYEHTIDEKSRLSIPAKFRDVVAATGDLRLMVTNFRDRGTPCLDVFTIPGWANFENRIQQRPEFDPRHRAFREYYIGGALDCPLDKQGRILVPSSLRDYARLERDVTITGLGQKFSVFDRRAWAQHLSDVEKAIFEDPTYLVDLGL